MAAHTHFPRDFFGEEKKMGYNTVVGPFKEGQNRIFHCGGFFLGENFGGGHIPKKGFSRGGGPPFNPPPKIFLGGHTNFCAQ